MAGLSFADEQSVAAAARPHIVRSAIRDDPLRRVASVCPSYVQWVWEVAGAVSGTDVTVTWDCYLKTFDRRVFAGPLRKRMLAREVSTSLRAMASAVTATARPQAPIGPAERYSAS
jgi:hypothetical protein